MFEVINTKKILNTREAVPYLLDKHGLVVAEKTLSKGRWSGTGPRFIKIGTRRVGYRPEELDSWAMARLSEPMTSTVKQN